MRFRDWLGTFRSSGISWCIPRFDAIVNFAALCWPSDLALQALPAIKGIKVPSTPGFSTLHRVNYQGYYQGLPARLRYYNAFVVTSANYQDARWLMEQGFGDQVVVIPNGASREEFLATPRASFRARFGIRTPHLCITVAKLARRRLTLRA